MLSNNDMTAYSLKPRLLMLWQCLKVLFHPLPHLLFSLILITVLKGLRNDGDGHRAG